MIFPGIPSFWVIDVIISNHSSGVLTEVLRLRECATFVLQYDLFEILTEGISPALGLT